jgi:hypothetical protein
MYFCSKIRQSASQKKIIAAEAAHGLTFAANQKKVNEKSSMHMLYGRSFYCQCAIQC